MSTSIQTGLKAKPARRKLSVALARSEWDVLEAQRLRYRIFAGELGANLPTRTAGVDQDIYDPFCEHLIVRDDNDGIVVGTSPQQLVSMIVEKAVHMAGMMNIPVLALVQNMSYVECPGCKEVIHPFGKSDIQMLADKHDIPATAELPIQSALATACDAGLIELFEGDWLNGLADEIEGMVKSAK